MLILPPIQQLQTAPYPLVYIHYHIPPHHLVGGTAATQTQLPQRLLQVVPKVREGVKELLKRIENV